MLLPSPSASVIMHPWEKPIIEIRKQKWYLKPHPLRRVHSHLEALHTEVAKQPRNGASPNVRAIATSTVGPVSTRPLFETTTTGRGEERGRNTSGHYGQLSVPCARM